MIKTEQAVAGILKYIDAEIIPALPEAKRWLVAGGAYYLRRRPAEFVAKLSSHPLIAASGVVDENGSIDAEGLYHACQEACKTHKPPSFNIPFIGKIELAAEDFDAIYQYIKEAAE